MKLILAAVARRVNAVHGGNSFFHRAVACDEEAVARNCA